MADLQVYKGLKANLPSAKKEGKVYVTIDNPGLYVDISDSQRIHISEFAVVANTTELNAITSPNPDILYYVTEGNILVKYNGTQFVQINSLQEVKTMIGTLTSLHTTEKSNLVGAINEVYDETVETITVNDGSLEKTVTDRTFDLKVKRDATTGNLLKLADGRGLRVDTDEVAQIAKDAVVLTDYTISVETPETTEVSKRYIFKQLGNTVATVDIPKDMVVKSGAVEVNPDASHTGTFLVLTLANATEDKVYIDVGNLIDVVESGSQTADPIQITITDGNKISASIKDNSIVEGKLSTAFLNKEYIGSVTGGISSNTPGQISYQMKSLSGTTKPAVAIKLFNDTSAAFSDADDFDAAGAASTVKTELIGTTNDASTALTLNGLKKAITEAEARATITWGSF